MSHAENARRSAAYERDYAAYETASAAFYHEKLLVRELTEALKANHTLQHIDLRENTADPALQLQVDTFLLRNRRLNKLAAERLTVSVPPPVLVAPPPPYDRAAVAAAAAAAAEAVTTAQPARLSWKGFLDTMIRLALLVHADARVASDDDDDEQPSAVVTAAKHADAVQAWLQLLHAGKAAADAVAPRDVAQLRRERANDVASHAVDVYDVARASTLAVTTDLVALVERPVHQKLLGAMFTAFAKAQQRASRSSLDLLALAGDHMDAGDLLTVLQLHQIYPQHATREQILSCFTVRTGRVFRLILCFWFLFSCSCSSS